MRNMDNKIIFGIGGIIIGLVIAVFFAPALFPNGNGSFGMMGSRPSQVANTIDRHFIEQMIPHHDGAVAMAKLALEKSKRTEIKILATAIIEDQTKEIKDMTRWYRDWFGEDVSEANTGMMGGGMMSSGGMHMGGQEDMTALESATDFDKAFIEAMIPHHQLALMMVRMLEAGTSRPEMLQLAKNITTSQSREIEQMQDWYRAWYK